MSAVSLTAVGQLKGQTAPYSLASITGTVYDSAGTTFTIPTPKSLVFFRGKTFTAPYTVPNMVNPISPVAGNGQVSLSWSEPYNGGSPITGYTVKYSNGISIATITNTSYTVTGLTNGTSYTFIVTANNIAGSSSPSSSPSATPVVPVNNLKIVSTFYMGDIYDEDGNYVDFGPIYTIYDPPRDTLTYYELSQEVSMSGGNSGPIYITFRTNAFNGNTNVTLNHVNYGNNGNLSVYFPYGLVSGTFYQYPTPNGASVTISQTSPTEGYLMRRFQNADGNAITWP